MKSLILVSLGLATVSGTGEMTKEMSIQEHDLQRMVNTEHEIDENVRKFKENLEGLRTTVDFEPMTV